MSFRFNHAAAVAGCALIIVSANAADTSATITGSWKLSNWTSSTDRVQLELTRRTLTSRWIESRDYAFDELRGLTREQMHSLHANVRFELPRDAGVFICEGSVTAGLGGGTFQFAPSQAFAAETRRMGYEAGPDTLFSMAVHDVNLVFVRAVQKAGLRNTTAETLIRLRIHGITPEYITDIKASGYDYDAEDLVRLKIHGVQTEFLRTLKKVGYNVSSEEAAKLRIHGVDSEYVRGVADKNGQLGVEDIVRFRIHGVAPEFVQALRAARYDFAPADIVNLRIQGVNSEYARDLKRAGYDLPARDIISLRQNGVSAEFLNQLHAVGYDRASTHDIIRMWQNGVRGEYISRLHAAFGAGAKNLSPDQIIKLKVNGVD